MLNEEVSPCGTDMLWAVRPDQQATELARVATVRRPWDALVDTQARSGSRARRVNVESQHIDQDGHLSANRLTVRRRLRRGTKSQCSVMPSPRPLNRAISRSTCSRAKCGDKERGRKARDRYSEDREIAEALHRCRWFSRVFNARLLQIPGVREVTSSVVMTEVKKTTCVPLPADW